MNKIFRFLRFNTITKFLFRIKWTDYIIRRFFIRKLHDYKSYSDTSKNALDINNELNPILKKYNAFLGHGVALSIIRDNKIPDYQDLDYDIYDTDNLENFIHDLIKLDFHLKFKGCVNGKISHMIFSKYNAHIDFFVCNVKNEIFYLNTISCETAFPKYKLIGNVRSSNKYIAYSRKMSYTAIEKNIFFNNIFYLPKNFDVYFSEMYGKDWRKQKKYFNWSINPKNNKPHILKKNVYIEIYE